MMDNMMAGQMAEPMVEMKVEMKVEKMAAIMAAVKGTLTVDYWAGQMVMHMAGMMVYTSVHSLVAL